MTYLVPFC